MARWSRSLVLLALAVAAVMVVRALLLLNGSVTEPHHPRSTAANAENAAANNADAAAGVTPAPFRPRCGADLGSAGDGEVALAVPCAGTLVLDGFETAVPALGGAKAPPADAAGPAPGGDVQRSPLFVVAARRNSWKEYVSSEFYALHRTLVEAYGWKAFSLDLGALNTWDDAVDRLRSNFGRVPDAWLILEDYKGPDHLELAAARTGAMSARDVFVHGASGGGSSSSTSCTDLLLLVDDLHAHSADQRAMKARVFRAASVILSTYEPVFEQITGISRQRDQVHVRHFPHSAGPMFMLPLNPQPREAVLLCGASDEPWYPYRAMVRRLVREHSDPRFVELAHAGYVPLDRTETNSSAVGKVGLAFSQYMNAHLACITDGSILNYTVAKIFEIPATGCLLLLNAEMTAQVAELGFKPWVHYVPYTGATLNSTVDFVLHPDNRALVDMVRAQGQALVWARHTTATRAAALDELARERHENRRAAACTSTRWGVR